jgi:hypothetical protein
MSANGRFCCGGSDANSEHQLFRIWCLSAPRDLVKIVREGREEVKLGVEARYTGGSLVVMTFDPD